MRAVFATPAGREALAVASPSTLAALDRGDPSARLTRTLLRYLLRSTARATPFGLFAAVSTAVPGTGTRLTVGPEVRAVGATVALPDADRWWPEPSLVDTGEHLHWYAGGQVVRVRATDDLRRGLRAADGCARAELGRRIGAGAAQVLIDLGLVVSAPVVTAVPAVVAPPFERLRHGDFSVVAVRDGDPPTWGPDLERRLVEAAADAHAVTGSATTPLVARFARRFADRFGERWVPLADALDHEVGAGALVSPEPLLAGLPTGRGAAAAYDRRRVELLLRALHDGATDVEAPAADDPPPMPEAIGLLARVDAAGTVLVEAAYPTGSRLLGRFAHADPLLAQAIRTHHDREAARHPGAVLAEIAHLPAPDAAAVVARPVLRDAEIVLLAAPGAERTIRPADLLVGVVDGEVQLRLEDGTRVLPRLASAHVPGPDALPLYRFLVELQGAGIGWTWGPLASAPYLPRVRRGRTLLARQTWNVDAGETAGALRARLPRWVAVVDGGQELPLDLTSGACRDLLDHELARGRRRIREVWPLPEDSPAAGYAAELVVALTRTGRVEAPAPQPVSRRRPVRHLPGGEWLSLAVHCAPSVQDDLLLAARPVLADRDWFFVRYADDLGPHLRLRVRHGDDLFGDLRALADRPDVRSLRVDTYEAEVERYGGPDHLRTAERVFAVDSRALLDLLPVGADARWRLAVAAVDALWGGADLSRIESVRDAFAREMGLTTADRAVVGRRFRDERRALEEVRNPLLDSRSRELAPLLASLPDRVVPSLSHMTLNRWLRARHREQEAVVYDLLVRLRRARQERSG